MDVIANLLERNAWGDTFQVVQSGILGTYGIHGELFTSFIVMKTCVIKI